MNKTMQKLWKDEEGANAVEYGLIAALIAVALIVVFTAFKDELAGMFDRQGGEIQSST